MLVSVYETPTKPALCADRPSWAYPDRRLEVHPDAGGSRRATGLRKKTLEISASVKQIAHPDDRLSRRLTRERDGYKGHG